MTEAGPVLPMGKVKTTGLEFFWLVDCSGSMVGEKISTLNNAINDVLPDVRDSAANQPQCVMQMRALKFDSMPEWHGERRPVDQYVWQPLTAGGSTCTARAIQQLCDQLEKDKMPKHAYPPVCVLLSDGYCTDSSEDYASAIERLNNLFWGKNAIRLAIAIGKDGEYDEAQLNAFQNQEMGVLKAYTVRQLVGYIRYATLVGTKSSTIGRIDIGSQGDVPDLSPTTNDHFF